MGCDYWKILTVIIEHVVNYKLVTFEKEFSIEPCNFYDIEPIISNSLENDEASIERIHKRRVLERLRLTPIPEPIILFANGRWTPVCEKYRDRVEKLIDDNDMQNIKIILLKTSFQCSS
jgi:hypothetical protein